MSFITMEPENAHAHTFKVGQKVNLSSHSVSTLETIDICAVSGGTVFLKEWIQAATHNPGVTWDHENRSVAVLNRTHSHLSFLFHPSSKEFSVDAHTEEHPVKIPRKTLTENTHLSIEFQKGKPLWEKYLIQEQNFPKGSSLTLSRDEASPISHMIVTKENKLQFYGEGYSEKELAPFGGREEWGFRIYNNARQEVSVMYLDTQGEALPTEFTEGLGENLPGGGGLAKLFSPPQETCSIQISLSK